MASPALALAGAHSIRTRSDTTGTRKTGRVVAAAPQCSSSSSITALSSSSSSSSSTTTTFGVASRIKRHDVSSSVLRVVTQQKTLKRKHTRIGAVVNASAGGEKAAAPTTAFTTFSDGFASLFPVWTVLSALVGLKNPAAFGFMSSGTYTYALALLMFSMASTLTPADFKRAFTKPDVVGVGFLACYVVMPAAAACMGAALGLSPPLLAGLVLVGSVNGGQASTLCTYIARGDVALSVLMTLATTVGCIFATPLLCKALLGGAVVDVDALGMAASTVRVVLVPVAAGLFLNKAAPRVCRAVEPACPVVGVLVTVILVGASVANCAEGILNAGLRLQAAAFGLHLVGGAVGYWMMRLLRYDETVCRTAAIETSMKSSAFGFLLAALHFPDYLVRVPSAVSVVWMAVVGSTMAVVWRFIPVEEDEMMESGGGGGAAGEII
jgi:BASS family bile acid:Na+ symporter